MLHRYQEVTGLNPVKVLTFLGFYIRNGINCFHNCEHNRLLHFTSAVQYMKYVIYISTDRILLYQHVSFDLIKGPFPTLVKCCLRDRRSKGKGKLGRARTRRVRKFLHVGISTFPLNALHAGLSDTTLCGRARSKAFLIPQTSSFRYIFERVCFPDNVVRFQNLSMSEVLHFPGVVYSRSVCSSVLVFLCLVPVAQ